MKLLIAVFFVGALISEFAFGYGVETISDDEAGVLSGQMLVDGVTNLDPGQVNSALRNLAKHNVDTQQADSMLKGKSKFDLQNMHAEVCERWIRVSGPWQSLWIPMTDGAVSQEHLSAAKGICGPGAGAGVTGEEASPGPNGEAPAFR